MCITSEEVQLCQRSRSEVSRSVLRLEELKADYRAVTGREWSEVRGLLIINLINDY